MDADANADAEGSTTALREHCSGELMSGSVRELTILNYLAPPFFRATLKEKSGNNPYFSKVSNIRLAISYLQKFSLIA